MKTQLKRRQKGRRKEGEIKSCNCFKVNKLFIKVSFQIERPESEFQSEKDKFLLQSKLKEKQKRIKEINKIDTDRN